MLILNSCLKLWSFYFEIISLYFKVFCLVDGFGGYKCNWNNWDYGCKR